MGDALIIFLLLLFCSVIASDATLKRVTNAASESSLTQGPRLLSHLLPSPVNYDCETLLLNNINCDV
jgi:hypothetical protein